MKINLRSMKLLLIAGMAIVSGQSILVSTALAGGPYQDTSESSYREEEAKIRAVIKQNPKNDKAYLQLGRLFEVEARDGYWYDCSEAEIRVYREAIVVIDTSAEIHFKLGQALMSDPSNSSNCATDSLEDVAKIKNRKREALSHLLQATLMNPAYDEYLIALGDALKEKDDLDAALVAYKTAVYLNLTPNPNLGLFSSNKSLRYTLIGDEFQKKGDFKTAEAAYQKSLSIEPDNALVQDSLRKVKH